MSRRELAPPSSTCSWARKGMSCHSPHTTTGASSLRIPTLGHTLGVRGTLHARCSLWSRNQLPVSHLQNHTTLALGQAQVQGLGRGEEGVGGQLGETGIKGVFLFFSCVPPNPVLMFSLAHCNLEQSGIKFWSVTRQGATAGASQLLGLGCQ